MMTGNTENRVEVYISKELILDLLVVLRRRDSDENVSNLPRWFVRETEEEIVIPDSGEAIAFFVELLKAVFKSLNLDNPIVAEIEKSVFIDLQQFVRDPER